MWDKQEAVRQSAAGKTSPSNEMTAALTQKAETILIIKNERNQEVKQNISDKTGEKQSSNLSNEEQETKRCSNPDKLEKKKKNKITSDLCCEGRQV